jgi:outer membrane receptor protein involved in Fe transport
VGAASAFDLNPTSMKLLRTRTVLISAVGLLALGGQLSRAQTAPASPTTTQEEAVKLDPFNVSADADVGFVAASSLAGGRIASALKDTPVAYSVITKEFLDAFNVQDIVEASQWSTNANIVEGDGGSRMYGYSAATYVRQRGIKMGLPSQNYFTQSGTADSYNIDRVDMARGPNSSVFGAGGVGGTMNSMTKQAEPTKSITELQMRIGSFDTYRFTIDVNRPVNDRFAVRVNAFRHDQGSWRDNFFQTKGGATIAAKWVLTPKLNLRAEVQQDFQLDGSITASMRDQISAWDGQTTFSTYGLPPTTPRFSTNNTQNSIEVARRGLSAAIPQRFVESAEWGHVFMNFQNRFTTKGAQHNATSTNYINGQPIRTVGFSLHNAAWGEMTDGVPSDRWTRALAGSPWMRTPRSEDTWLWTNRSRPGAETHRKLASLFATWTPTDNLFFEVAGNYSTSDQFGENTQRRGLIDTKIDINRDLPDGSPNPGFLKPYIDVFVYRVAKDYEMAQGRAQMVYSKTFSRLGTLRFSALTGFNRNEVYAHSESMLLPLTSLAPDARTWTDVSEQSEYGAWTRWHLTDGSSRIWYDNSEVQRVVYNPLNGVREAVKPRFITDLRKPDNNYLSVQESKYIQGSGNFDLFRNRLIITGAYRHDLTSLDIKRSVLPGAAPVGWDGYGTFYAPPAPADYWDLKFFPKSPTGQITGPEEIATTRPRVRATSGVVGDRANGPRPQYANDRFQDDYSTPPIKDDPVNTWTYGAVVNLWKGIGVFANKSSTWNFSQPAQRVDGTVIPPTAAEGKDYGLRFTLPGNRLYVTATRYDSFQDGATVRAGTGTNPIANVAPVGDISATGINNRGYRLVPTDTYSTFTNTTSGYEFEVTANFTRDLRLVANAGYTDAQQTEYQTDILEYYDKNDAIIRQVLADAGVAIGADNVAFIRPEVDDPTMINQEKVTAAVNAWNTINTNTIPNLRNRGKVIQGGSSKWTYNLAVDYRFSRTPLRGLRVGTGFRYRGGQAIGSLVNDTIRDPNNPNNAIDDPSVDASTPLWGPSSINWVGSLSYTIRLPESQSRGRPRTIQLDLNIDNLANNRDLVYGNINDVVQTSNTYFRPRVGEDISSPARRTVPGTFSYVNPRNYTLSAKFNW